MLPACGKSKANGEESRRGAATAGRRGLKQEKPRNIEEEPCWEQSSEVGGKSKRRLLDEGKTGAAQAADLEDDEAPRRKKSHAGELDPRREDNLNDRELPRCAASNAEVAKLAQKGLCVGSALPTWA